MLRADIKVKGIEAIRLVGTKLDLAVAQSMNAAMGVAKTASFKAIRGKYKIKVKDLKLFTTTTRATQANTAVRFTLRGQSIPLLYFVTPAFKRMSRYEQSKRKGVRYSIIKGKSTSVMNSAFINKSKTRGRDYVMKRSDKARYPAPAKTVISAASMFEGVNSADLFFRAFKKNFRTTFKSRLNHLSKK